MEIRQWQQLFSEAADRKFSKKWDRAERFAAIRKQIDDAERATTPKEFHKRLACILPDIFILCADFQIDLEKELDPILEWFQDQKAGFSH